MVVIGLDVIIIGTDGKIGGVSKTSTGIVGKGFIGIAGKRDSTGSSVSST